MNPLKSALPALACAAILSVATLAAVSAATPAPAPALTPRAAFERAAIDFQRGRFSAAYGQFVHLADHGDTRAAAIALLMHREGRGLFRTDWDASTDQLADWQALALDALRREAVQP